MGFDGLYRDEEILRDFDVGPAGGGQTADSKLRGGQRVGTGASEPPRSSTGRVKLIPGSFEQALGPAAIR